MHDFVAMFENLSDIFITAQSRISHLFGVWVSTNSELSQIENKLTLYDWHPSVSEDYGVALWMIYSSRTASGVAGKADSGVAVFSTLETDVVCQQYELQ